MTTKKKLVLFAVSFVYLALLGLIGLICAASYQSFKNTNIDLSLADIYENRVVSKGTATKSSKYFTRRVKYVTLQGSAQKFGLFDSNLFDTVNQGDTLKFYYENSHDDMVLTIYQIEKGGQIIKDKKEYEGTEKNLFYFTLLGSAFMIGVVGWSLKTIRIDKFREL